MSEQTFQPGCCVTLVSGGPLMTVEATGGNGVGCVWFDAEGKLNRDWFPPQTLRHGPIPALKPGGLKPGERVINQQELAAIIAERER
jgi:uncharacterized protein YodC (DUF2158 family)